MSTPSNTMPGHWVTVACPPSDGRPVAVLEQHTDGSVYCEAGWHDGTGWRGAPDDRPLDTDGWSVVGWQEMDDLCNVFEAMRAFIKEGE